MSDGVGWTMGLGDGARLFDVSELCAVWRGGQRFGVVTGVGAASLVSSGRA